MDKAQRELAVLVGKAVKARRLKAGLTQGDLGELVSREADSISRIECGKVLPPLTLLAELAGALKCPLSDLLRDGSTKASDRSKRLELILTGLSESDAATLVDVIELLSAQFKKKKPAKAG